MCVAVSVVLTAASVGIGAYMTRPAALLETMWTYPTRHGSVIADGLPYRWTMRRYVAGTVLSTSPMFGDEDGTDAAPPPTWSAGVRLPHSGHWGYPYSISTMSERALGWPFAVWVDRGMFPQVHVNTITHDSFYGDLSAIPRREAYWPGMIGNIAFYSIILFLLHTAFITLRTRIRTACGRCPICAYDLTGHESGVLGVCPECGVHPIPDQSGTAGRGISEIPMPG